MISVGSVALALLFWGVTANINELFDLDGDATYNGSSSEYDPAFPPHLDWNLIASYAPCGEELCGDLDLEANGIKAVFSGIVHDQDLENRDEICRFHQTKDTFNTADFQWSHSSVPDEKDISNAYVFGMLDENDTINIYFGLDLFAEPGQATVGFWFFQELVKPVCDDGSELKSPNDCDSGNFSGNHTDGDLLIHLEMGDSTSVKLRSWDGAEDKLSMNVIELNPMPVCATAQSSHFGVNQVCAITNGNNEVPVCWSHTNKEDMDDCNNNCTVGTNRFFEGGISLHEYFQVALSDTHVPCFRSFLAETRSSDSKTADLIDFVSGEIDMCGFEFDYECELPTDVGNGQWDFSATVSVKNTGLLTYYNVQLQTVSGDVLATIDRLDPFDTEYVDIIWTREGSNLEVLTLDYCVSPESPCRKERRQSRKLSLFCEFATTVIPTTLPSISTSKAETMTSTTKTPTTTTEAPTTTLETSTSMDTDTSTTETTTFTTETETTEIWIQFECDDGCLLSEGYYDDGYCDCSQCEDEPNWSCASCAGCPTFCGSWKLCSRQQPSWCQSSTTTETATTNSETDSDGNSFELSIWQLAFAAVGVICLLLICALLYCWRCRNAEQNKDPRVTDATEIKDEDIVGEEDYVEEDVHLIDGKPVTFVEETGEHSISGYYLGDIEGAKQRRASEGVVKAAVTPVVGVTPGRFEPGDAVADEDLSDEIMYTAMPETRV